MAKISLEAADNKNQQKNQTKHNPKNNQTTQTNKHQRNGVSAREIRKTR